MILRLRSLALLLFFAASIGQAEEVRVGFYNAPPLMIQQGNRGIYHDLLQRIGAITGDRFLIEYYSIARLQRSFEEGKLDLEPGINPIWRQQSKVPGLYSDNFASLEQVLLFRPGKSFDVTGPQSLAGMRIGTIRGYVYPAFMQSFSDGDIERIDVTDEPQLLRLLERGRVDQVFIDRVVLNYWVRQNPKFEAYQTSGSLGNVDIKLRLHPSRAGLLDRLNRALAQLRQQGAIEQIFNQYR